MSAELLRRAAAVLREAASTATPDVCPGYVANVIAHAARVCPSLDCGHETRDRDYCPDNPGTFDKRDDPRFYALWHPAFAQSLAAWLEATADAMTFWSPYRPGEQGYPMWSAALNLAHAVLRDEATGNEPRATRRGSSR